MEEGPIWETLTRIFRESLEDDTLALFPETTAADVEGWDSVTHIELMVAVERAFGIRLRTGEVAGLANVGALAELVRRRAGGER